MEIAQPITLPCGLKLPNRLVKAAMAEAMGSSTALPTKKHSVIYSQWAEGDWGMVITGNVQADAKQLGNVGDLAATNLKASRSETVAAWKDWAARCKVGNTPTIVQLCHPGRQSPLGARWTKSMAPSPVPLNLGDSLLAKAAAWLVFGTPHEMTVDDIEKVVQQFADAARLAEEAGFDGVQLHGAHGYLLTQFISSKTNLRTDDYGGTPAKRVRIVQEILRAIRAATKPGFCLGIKLNSADHQQEHGLEESLEQLGLILAENVDFVEISGGTYEKPDMMANDTGKPVSSNEKPASARTQKREAFFLEYAQTARERFPGSVLMVTGGFRSREGMNHALKSDGCNLIGIGRPAAVYPRLPKEILLNKDVQDAEAVANLEPVKMPWLVNFTGIKPMGAGVITQHYQGEMRNLIAGKA